MPKQDLFEKLRALAEVCPEHITNLKKDVKKNCDSLVQKTLNEFNLVTREEFDVQTKVLLRTRKKLEALEKLVKQLEKDVEVPAKRTTKRPPAND